MELIDIVNENNEFTGQIEEREIAYEKGLWRNGNRFFKVLFFTFACPGNFQNDRQLLLPLSSRAGLQDGMRVEVYECY